MKDEVNPECLVGKWFHQVKPDGETGWQGHILSMPFQGTYLVQLYSWLTGGCTDQVLVPGSDMMTWRFYEDNEDMNFAWEYRWEPKK